MSEVELSNLVAGKPATDAVDTKVTTELVQRAALFGAEFTKYGERIDDLERLVTKLIGALKLDRQ